MRFRFVNSRALHILVFSALLAVNGGAAHATTYTWTGGGTDRFWSNGQNWSGGQAPITGADTAIVFAGTTNLQPSQDIASGFVLNSLTFTSGGGAFLAGGMPLDFSVNTKPGTPAISQQAFSSVAINNDLLLGDNLSVATTYDTTSALGALSLTLGGSLSGPGSLTVNGSAPVALTGMNTYTGGTIFAKGTLVAGSAGALGGTGTLSFSGGTLRYSAANQTDYSPRFSTVKGQMYTIDTNGQNVTLAAALNGGGSLTKLGTGTLTLTGNNSFASGVAISGGVLNVGSAGALGTAGTITMYGTLQYSAVYTADYSGRFSTADNQYAVIDTNGQNVTFAKGFTSARGGFAKLGAGTLTLSGTVDTGQATPISAGILELATGGTVANSYLLIAGGAACNFTGGTVASSSGGFELGTTAGTATANMTSGGIASVDTYVGYVGTSVATFNQTGGTVVGSLYLANASGSTGNYNLGGTGSVSVQGAFIGYGGTGVFTQNAGTFNANANGLYLGFNGGSSGTYNLNGGTLVAGSIGKYQGASVFNFNGGTLQNTASGTFMQGLTTANVRVGGATINTNGNNVTLAQALLHDTTNGAPATDGGLTKNGAGALTLSAANTYNGGTQINAGQLVLSGSSTLGGGGNIGVAAIATLDVSGLANGYFLNAGGTLNNLGIITGNLTVASNGVYTGGGTINGLLSVQNGGLVSIGGGTLTVNGGVTNGGTIRLERGASLVVGNGGTFTNGSGGTLDIITGSVSAPAGFYNGGTVLDASVVKVRSVNPNDGMLTVDIDGYTGHVYQLQRSGSLLNASYGNVGPAQNGVTGQTLGFTDATASGTQAFYRVQIDP